MANESSLSNVNSVYNQILFANHAGDFPATGGPTTAANNLTLANVTDVEMDFDNIAASGGGIQSAKFDFGDVRSSKYVLDGCIEFETAPTDNLTVDFWIGFSNDSAASEGNPGGLSGSASSYTETDGTLGQLRRIGRLVTRNNVICIGHIGIIIPYSRYGILVAVNNANQAGRSTATAMDETHIVATPASLLPAA